MVRDSGKNERVNKHLFVLQTSASRPIWYGMVFHFCRQDDLASPGSRRQDEGVFVHPSFSGTYFLALLIVMYVKAIACRSTSSSL